MRIVEVAVVGAGPAGCAAAVQCARLGLVPELYDISGCAGGLVANAFLVENYPGPEAPLPGAEMARRLAGHLARFGLRVVKGDVKIVAGSNESTRLAFADQEIEARALILAPGTRPRPLGVAGEPELAGRLLFYEALPLLAAIRARGDVLVVGGGEAALDYALSLGRAGLRPRVLVRGGAPRANARLLGMAREAALSIETGVSVVSLRRDGDGVALAVEAAAGHREITADAVLAAVGRVSALPYLFPGASGNGMDEMTLWPGVFAAGDARLGRVGQVGCAVGDGLLAASAAFEHLRGA